MTEFHIKQSKVFPHGLNATDTLLLSTDEVSHSGNKANDSDKELVALLDPSCVVLQFYPKPPEPRRALYFVGDYIAECGSTVVSDDWMWLMQMHYAPSTDVINRVLSGCNTRSFLKQRLPVYEAELASEKFMPALIAIWFGASDAALSKDKLSEAHIPEEEYRSNLTTIVRRLRAVAPQAKILLVTSPAVNDRKFSKAGQVHQSNANTGRYSHICVDVAKVEAVPVVDLFAILNTHQSAKSSALFIDGAHLSSKGNQLVFDQLRKQIAELLGGKKLSDQRSWRKTVITALHLRILATILCVSLVALVYTTIRLASISSGEVNYLQPADPTIASNAIGGSPSTNTSHHPTFYFIGDSITELGSRLGTNGWVALMQEQYVRSAVIVNRGISGWNTSLFIERALPVYESELSSGQFAPALITVWFGANDAALIDGDSADKHVPEDQYHSNLVTILNRLQVVAPHAKILFITPPAVDDTKRLTLSPSGKLDRSNEAAGRYAQICVDTAVAEGVPVIDMHTLFNTFQGSSFTGKFADGLHMSSDGNRVVLDQLNSKIVEVFGAATAATFQQKLVQ